MALSARTPLLILLALALSMPASAVRGDAPPATPAFTYATIKELRDGHDGKSLPTFPEYSLDQQKLVVSQARLLLLGMYAHLTLKAKKFPRTAQPKLALDDLDSALAARTSPMDQTQFHETMMKIFLNERDLHTSYNLPKPYGCYGTSLPFSLDPVKDSKGNAELAIAKITTTAAILEKSPGIEKLSVGDVITKYDGEDPVRDLPKIDEDPGLSVREIGGGANPMARRRRAVEKLTFVSQLLDPFPAANDVQLHVLKRDGSELDVTLPWIVTGTTSCLKAAAPKTTASGSHSVSIEEYERLFQENFHPRTQEATESVDPLLDLSSPTQTKEPTIRFKVLTRKDAGQPDHKFGYLRLDSFAPTIAIDQVITMIQGLLSKEFAGTDGLIIDLRNNGGGQISYGEELIQLFSPRVAVTEQFRLRATKENSDFINLSPVGYSDFIKLMAEAPPGAVYTGTAPLTSAALANNRGTTYFKPVAILTNSSCYSTCDMFTAGMQDNRAAKIWSEDKNTGGGGANNVHYGDFRQILPPQSTSFPLPELPSGQDMGIAWRQAIRVGKNAGKILEGNGVHADRGETLPSSPDDLALNNLITVRTITDELLKDGKKYRSSVSFPDNLSTIDITGGKTKLQASLTGTSRVDYLSGGTLLGSQKIDEAQASASLTPPTLSGTSGRLDFQGYRGRKAAWRRSYVYRTIPPATTLPLALDPSSASSPGFAIFTPDNDPGLGWTAKNGQFQIGQGPTYANNVSTQASLFIAIPTGSTPTLTYGAQIDTEPGFDFFTVSVIAPGADPKVLGKYSGKIAEAPYTFALSDFAGKTVEIRFDFESDPGVNGSGVFLHDVSVK